MDEGSEKGNSNGKVVEEGEGKEWNFGDLGLVNPEGNSCGEPNGINGYYFAVPHGYMTPPIEIATRIRVKEMTKDVNPIQSKAFQSSPTDAAVILVLNRMSKNTGIMSK